MDENIALYMINLIIETKNLELIRKCSQLLYDNCTEELKPKIKGVFYIGKINKKTGKPYKKPYKALTTVNGKQKYLGYFRTYDQARDAIINEKMKTEL